MHFTNTFKQCLKILSSADRRKYWIVVACQGLLGFLDLLGVAILGVIGALAVRGIQSQPPSGSIIDLLSVLNISEFSFQSQVAILGLFASLVLVIRTLSSLFLSWKIINFLSARSAQISNDLLSNITQKGLLELQNKSTAHTNYILGPGVSSIAVGILGTISNVIGDISLLIIVTIGVLIIDPAIAVASIILFSSVILYLYLYLHKKTEKIGRDLTLRNIESNKLINEVILGYREIYVRNKLGYYNAKIGENKNMISKLQAYNNFIPSLSKYVIEISVVIGAAMIATVQFLLSDATHAVASLAIFIAAGTRVAPALLRIQTGALIIKSNIGLSELTLSAIAKFKNVQLVKSLDKELDFNHIGFNPEISLNNVRFSYERSISENIEIESLNVQPGTSLAIVGPSGAGKTTLVDLLLGVLTPTHGEVSISGLSASVAISKWPGSVSYVPQNIMIKEGTIAENIALGINKESITVSKLNEALRAAQLFDLVQSLPEKENTRIGEGGIGLSGGQRQRLGIARALYTNPKIIVFDEATSSLDGITEREISNTIANLKGNITLVVIAHRLSTVVNSDQIIFIENGRILACGTFENVRAAIPNFDEQAKLMGI